jgi:DNA-directed RNA polymerase specialized sigma24 family protein
MNKNPQTPNLEPAYQKLLREHPDLAQLPEPDRPSPDYAKFKAFLEWAAEIRESLDEPDRTILGYFLQGLTYREIRDRTNRSRGCVTGRLRKIKARFGGQLSANAFRGWRNW